MHTFLSSALACASLLSLSIPAVAADQAALAGHYYLQGVTEVGSELLLKKDGRFEWMLSYGAVDQQASGDWRVAGDANHLPRWWPRVQRVENVTEEEKAGGHQLSIKDVFANAWLRRIMLVGIGVSMTQQLTGMGEQCARLAHQIQRHVGHGDIFFQRRPVATPLRQTLAQDQAGVADAQQVLHVGRALNLH